MDPGTGWNQPSGRSRKRNTGGNPKRAARCARVGRPGTAPSRGLARIRGVRHSARRARMPPRTGTERLVPGTGSGLASAGFRASRGALRLRRSMRRQLLAASMVGFSLLHGGGDTKPTIAGVQSDISSGTETVAVPGATADRAEADANGDYAKDAGRGRRRCACAQTIAIRRAGSGDFQTVGTDLGGSQDNGFRPPARGGNRAATECRPAGGDRQVDRAIDGPGGGAARLGGRSRSVGCTIPLRNSRRTAGNGAARDRREAASGAKGRGQGNAERANRDHASGIALESACRREAPREQRTPKWIKAVRRAANCGKTSATDGRWASACVERHCPGGEAVLRRSCPGIWLRRIRAVAVFG